MARSMPPTADRPALDVSRDAELCAAILDPSLIAYLAGAGSLAEYRAWLSGGAGPGLASRLAAARRVIVVFRAENRLATAEPWLRALGAAGSSDIPARVIRDKGDDEAVGAIVAAAASQWLNQWRRPPAARR